MIGHGESRGAATIVNAMATGYGAAFGLDLRVRATTRPASTWRVRNGPRVLPAPRARLALTCARLVQRALNQHGPLRIDIESQIPPERGLKSSSAVSLAVLQATLDAYETQWPPQRLLEAAATAGIKSRTSLTGAVDDAAACLNGGVQLTHNPSRRVLHRARLPDDLTALVHVPRQRIPTRSVATTDFRPIRPTIQAAWDLARRGHTPDAMYLNTAAYALLWNRATPFTLDAIAAGAWAAGVSGKGPAEVALVRPAARRRLLAERPDLRSVKLFQGGRR